MAALWVLLRKDGDIIPGEKSLASIPVGLSKEAKQRLKWFDYYKSHPSAEGQCSSHLPSLWY